MSSAGKLRDRVIFQRADKSQNDYGELTDAWVEVDAVKANVTGMTGRELYRDGTIESQPVLIQCRYGSELGNLDTGDRVLVALGYTSTTSAVTATGLALKVTSASEFPPAVTPGGAGAEDYRIRLADELLTVTAGHGTTTWTVTRGTDGSTATSHAASVAVVYMAPLDIESVNPSGRMLEVTAVRYG